MATNSTFYNPTRKRRALDEHSIKNHHDNVHRMTLMKMANTTRTFGIQSDALKYIENREKMNNSEEILYLFSFESQPDGKRRYQVSDIDIFIHEYYQLPSNQRHTYEIIVDKKPSKLYFDLEYDVAANPTLNGPRLTTNFIQFVLNFMRKRSDDLDYTMKDVLILDSTSTKKFSRHLIFQTKDPFLDNLAVGKFVNLILEDIHGCLINHQCSAINNISINSSQISSNSTVFAKNLLSSLESRLIQFENCHCTDEYSQLKFQEIIEFIVRKVDGTGLTWFCDMGVYTKNRAFRLLHSSKFDKQECFTIAPENEWKPIIRSLQTNCTIPSEAERQIFLASLVYFNKPIRRFIHVDEEYSTAVQRIIPRTQRSNQSSSSYASEDIRKISIDYPELINYMNNLARDRNDNDNDIRISRLYKAKEIQNDFRWEISFMYVGDYKYCENIQRHHKHNNIYFVVDMRKGTYRQKCHDIDCKTFQSIERILPKNVTPWLLMLDDDWENFHS